MLKPGNIIAAASRTNLVRIRGEAMADRDYSRNLSPRRGIK
jgi:hypothetical protein